MLNEPTGGYEREAGDWTPAVGQRRALLVGVPVAAGLCIPLVALTCVLPLFLLLWYIRIPVAFGVTWLILVAVQRAAGMSAWRITLLGMALGSIVMLSTNVTLAARGFKELPLEEDKLTFPIVTALEMAGAKHDNFPSDLWMHPTVVIITNASSLIGVVLAGAWRSAQE